MYTIIIMINKCLFDFHTDVCIEFRLIVVFDRCNLYPIIARIFCRGRSTLCWHFSTPECHSTIYYLIRVERESGLPSLMVYSLSWWHSNGDKNIIKISQHEGSDVQDDTICRISGLQDTDVSIWLYTMEWCVVVVFVTVVMMINQGIS